MTKTLSRRTLLKGLGAAVALPWLEAMTSRSALAAGASRHPLRMAFLAADGHLRREPDDRAGLQAADV